MTRRRLPKVVAALTLTLLAATGCAQIPRSGPVVAGGAGQADPRDGVLQVFPDGPVPGASPEDLVRGFIRAAVGFADDHQAARSFLDRRRTLTWRPDADVQVFPAQKDLQLSAEVDEAAGTATVTAQAPVSITLDGDGRYALTRPGTRAEVEYEFVVVDGEWRIAELPDGILIAEPDFDATFRAFPVYFPDPSAGYLVPDVHWFAGGAAGSPQIPTALVRVLLQGPPTWLRGAVTTGAPSGTTMALDAVVVRDDVAVVDLSSQALQAGGTQRRILAGQLQATLSRLRPISSVEITVEQVEYDTRGEGEDGPARDAGAQPWLQSDPQVGPDIVVLDARGRLARLTGRSTEVIEGVDALRVLGANRPAVSSDRATFAVLDRTRSRLLVQSLNADRAEVAVRGEGLSAPSFDPAGWLWSGPAGNEGWVTASQPGAPAVRVRAPWLADTELVALRISRDGTRALVGLRSEGRGRVFVAGVLRDGERRPLQLTQPIGLIPDLAEVTDTAWVDEDQVAVLGRRPVGGEQVWVAQIGGEVVGRGGVPGALSVTAGDGESTLSVGTATGTYSYLQGWQQASEGRWPVYPG